VNAKLANSQAESQTLRNQLKLVLKEMMSLRKKAEEAKGKINFFTIEINFFG
jgi:hypothetical protein